MQLCIIWNKLNYFINGPSHEVSHAQMTRFIWYDGYEIIHYDAEEGNCSWKEVEYVCQDDDDKNILRWTSLIWISLWFIMSLNYHSYNLNPKHII